MLMTNEEIRKSKVRFSQQRCMAGKRGIEWKLTYAEWINWWLATGKYHLRGRGKGKYVMCRYNDCGAYELGNIYCDTHKSNLQSAHNGNQYNNGRKLSEDHKALISHSQRGAKNHWARKVIIHGQTYDCIKDAAAALGIGYSLCKKRLHNKYVGYKYL